MYATPITDDAELRPLEPWQATEFLAHVDRAREHIAPYIPWAAMVVDQASAGEFLQRYADRKAADAGRIDGIWCSGELVGGVLFRTFEVGSGVCELGVWLARDAVGRGLVTRASQRMIDWAIGDRGLNRVEWRCVPTNTRSIAAAERLGMGYEGTLRQVFPHQGRRLDLQVWAMLREEWPHRPWA